MFRWFSRKQINQIEEKTECEYVILESEEPEAKYYSLQELYEQNYKESSIDIEPIEEPEEPEEAEESKEIPKEELKVKEETVFLPEANNCMENTLRTMIEYILNFDIVIERCIINWCNF
jgi:hypothetical protein